MVLLRNSGGASGKNNYIMFDNKSTDLLFVHTIDGDNYLIPSEVITVSTALTLTPDFDKYKV